MKHQRQFFNLKTDECPSNDWEDILEEIEARFDISLQKRFKGGSSLLVTAGDLFEVTKRRLHHRYGAPIETMCLSRSLFYSIRRSLSATNGTTRNSVSPLTRWDELFPREQQVEFLWKETSLRHLEKSIITRSDHELIDAIYLALMMISPLSSLLLYFKLFPFGSEVFIVPFWVTVMVALTLPYLYTRYSPPYARKLVLKSDATLADTILHLKSRHYGLVTRLFRRWNEEEAWRVLQKLLSENCEIPAQQITRQSCIAEDLRIAGG